MTTSTGNRTKPQQARFDALKEMGCIACLKEEGAWAYAEIHHLVDGGYRKHSGGHDSTIPLCPWHHRGDPPHQWSAKATEEMLGPSMARTKKKFVERYGTERELLAEVNRRLGNA